MNEQPKIIRIVMHDRRAAGGGNAPGPGTPAKPKRKARWPWVVALLLLVAAAAGAGVWWWSGRAAELCFEKANAALERKEYAEAAKLFRKAADQGHADAQYELGMIYLEGLGVPVNDVESFKWFQQAAEGGNAEAQFKLSTCYLTGWGVEKNWITAFKWNGEAAKNGQADAQVTAGILAKKMGRSYKTAAEWFRKAAEQGNAEGQLLLGQMFEDGTGVAQDAEEACLWYRKAAEQGNAEAQLCLGGCCMLGKGVPQNEEEGVMWIRKAAEQGNSDAQALLGLLYRTGRGVPKNIEEAAKWLRMAAEQGNAKAVKQLERLGESEKLEKSEKSETATNRANEPPAAARPFSPARPTPKPAGTGGRTMTLAEYSPAIDANLKRNIQLSEAGQYLGAALGIVAQGRGEKLAKTLGVELSGKDLYEMDEILDRRGCGEVAEIIYQMSPKAMQTMASQGYPHICRLKFWRAATLEVLGNLPDIAATMFRHGRSPNKANLSQPEMEEILGALGIVRGTRLDDSAKEFAKHASYFNLDNGKDRDAFANSLKFSCVNDGNLALRNEMSADEVFRRIKDIAAILAAEAGMPEAAIARPAAADSASAGATGRAGNPGQGASRGGAGTPAPAASLSAALEAAKKAPTQENFERVEALWNGLPEERKTALQAGVMGAFCAMLLEKGDISEMAKRMKYVDFQALRKAVSETCQACGGTGRVKEKCPKCGGSGKCPGCHGSGAIGGLYGNKIACPKCKSSGRCPACTGGEKEAKCRACTGSGRVQSNAKCRKAMEENLAEALRICRKEGL